MSFGSEYTNRHSSMAFAQDRLETCLKMFKLPRYEYERIETFSGELVIHKSIRVSETGVTRVGSVINWLRSQISEMFNRIISVTE